jgi:membrane protein
VSSIILIGLAIAVVKLGPLAGDAVLGSSLAVLVCSLVLRWAIAIALLLLTVGLIVHYGPDRDRPLLKVTAGAALSIGCWIGASLLFGLYLTQIAQYGSLFGNLATVFVLLEYVWISVIAFIAGALLESEGTERAA